MDQILICTIAFNHIAAKNSQQKRTIISRRRRAPASVSLKRKAAQKERISKAKENEANASVHLCVPSVQRRRRLRVKKTVPKGRTLPYKRHAATIQRIRQPIRINHRHFSRQRSYREKPQFPRLLVRKPFLQRLLQPRLEI